MFTNLKTLLTLKHFSQNLYRKKHIYRNDSNLFQSIAVLLKLQIYISNYGISVYHVILSIYKQTKIKRLAYFASL